MAQLDLRPGVGFLAVVHLFNEFACLKSLRLDLRPGVASVATVVCVVNELASQKSMLKL